MPEGKVKDKRLGHRVTKVATENEGSNQRQVRDLQPCLGASTALRASKMLHKESRVPRTPMKVLSPSLGQHAAEAKIQLPARQPRSGSLPPMAQTSRHLLEADEEGAASSQRGYAETKRQNKQQAPTRA